MNNLKKVLCLVMSMAMLFSVMVVGASAKTFPDQKDIQNTEAVNMAVALNIIQGRDTGDFDPTGNITRAEMAKMICVLWGGGNEPKMSGATGEASYSDINGHWAEKYIEFCSSLDIIAGMGDGTFNPWGNVTGTEAAKMLLVCLGYDAAYEGFNGLSWSTKIDVAANYKGLYADMTSDFLSGNKLTRDNAAQMVWNALQAYTVSYETNNEFVNGQWTTVKTLKDKTDVNNSNETIYITLMYDKYDRAQETDGRLTNFKYDDKKKEWTYTVTDREKVTEKGEPVEVGTFTSETDYTNLYMQNVTAVFNLENKKGSTTVDKFYGMYADESSVLVSDVIGAIDTANAKDTKLTINDKSYKLENKAEDTLVYAFGQGQNGAVFGGEDQEKLLTNSDELDKILAYSFDALDYDDDNTIDCIVVHPIAVAQIDYLTSSKLTLTEKGGYALEDYSYDLDDDDVTIYKDAKEDDYVVVTDGQYTTDGYVQVTKADIVSGKVTATKNNPITDVKVSDTWYGIATPDNDDVNGIKNNDEYDLTVVNGYVFNAEKTKGSVSAKNVLYVEKSGALNSSGIADGVDARVWFSDGTKKAVTITTLTMPKEITIGGITYDEGKDYDIVYDATKTDEISNVNAGIIIGGGTEGDKIYNGYKLYTYSEKGGDYSIEPVSMSNKGGYDDVIDETNAADGGQLTIKDGKTNGEKKARFADEAVIFVHDKDGVKVVKGKTVTNWKDTDVQGVYGWADKSNGTFYTAIGAIEMTNSKASSDARVYGWITSDISNTDEDGTDYLKFNMWDGTGTDPIEVKVEDTNDTRDLKKYDFVAFDWEDQDNNEADADDFLIKTAKADAVAITAFADDDDISVKMQDGSKPKTYEFADDYFVIGVNTDGGNGSNTKTLKIAKSNPDKDGYLSANAIIFTVQNGTKEEVEAVFIDTGIGMHTDKGGVVVNVPE